MVVRQTRDNVQIWIAFHERKVGLSHFLSFAPRFLACPPIAERTAIPIFLLLSNSFGQKMENIRGKSKQVPKQIMTSFGRERAERSARGTASTEHAPVTEL